jgi:hypothetical protein
VLATIEALAEERDVEDKIWGSMIKQALKRQRPGSTRATTASAASISCSRSAALVT